MNSEKLRMLADKIDAISFDEMSFLYKDIAYGTQYHRHKHIAGNLRDAADYLEFFKAAGVSGF